MGTPDNNKKGAESEEAVSPTPHFEVGGPDTEVGPARRRASSKVAALMSAVLAVGGVVTGATACSPEADSGALPEAVDSAESIGTLTVGNVTTEGILAYRTVDNMAYGVPCTVTVYRDGEVITESGIEAQPGENPLIVRFDSGVERGDRVVIEYGPQKYPGVVDGTQLPE